MSTATAGNSRLARAPEQGTPGVRLHVRGIDHGEQAAGPAAGVNARWRAAKAARVAVWSPGSPAICSRNASEESTSSGAKCRAANVDFPDPAAPISTTSDGSGISIDAELAHGG